MKARLVSEAIKFERGKSPISTMGIGTVGNLPKIIFEADLKTGYGVDNEEQIGGQGEIHPGTIRSIVQKSSRILIQFYQDRIRNIKTGKSTPKINYAEKLIKSAGLENLFKRIYYEHNSSTAVYLTLIDEYKGHFKHEEVFYPDDFGIGMNESINFERGKEPKTSMDIGLYAGLENILSDEDELRHYLVQIDNALYSATEIYLDDEKAKKLATMWWEDSHGIKNWEFKSIMQSIEDEPEEERNYPNLNYEIEKLKRQGWKVFNIEDNFDLSEVILYRPGRVHESINFERGENPKKGMGLGKYAPQIVEVKDWDGNPMKIKVQNNTFKINDYEIRVEFRDETPYDDDEVEHMADVYVDGQKSDMNVFKMYPFDYEFTTPKKPIIKVGDKYESDPNSENWSKTESAYGYPLVDKNDKEKLQEMKEKYSYWHVSSGGITRTNKNPFAAIAEMFMATY